MGDWAWGHCIEVFWGSKGSERYIVVVSILATCNHFLLLVLMGLFTSQLDSSASSNIIVDLLNMNLDKVLLVYIERWCVVPLFTVWIVLETVRNTFKCCYSCIGPQGMQQQDCSQMKFCMGPILQVPTLLRVVISDPSAVSRTRSLS